MLQYASPIHPLPPLFFLSSPEKKTFAFSTHLPHRRRNNHGSATRRSGSRNWINVRCHQTRHFTLWLALRMGGTANTAISASSRLLCAAITVTVYLTALIYGETAPGLPHKTARVYWMFGLEDGSREGHSCFQSRWSRLNEKSLSSQHLTRQWIALLKKNEDLHAQSAKCSTASETPDEDQSFHM